MKNRDPVSTKTLAAVLSIAKEEGFELSDEDLEAVSGGGWFDCDANTGGCPNKWGKTWGEH